MSVAKLLLTQSSDYLTKMYMAQSKSLEVEVEDFKTKSSTTYNSIIAAAKSLDIDKRYIEHYIYLNQKKPVLGRYTFKLLNSILIDTDQKPGHGKQSSLKVKVTIVQTQEVKIYPSLGAAARAPPPSHQLNAPSVSFFFIYKN